MPELDMQILQIKEEIVLKSLQNLKINKSPGPDGLHHPFIRELAPQLSEPLTIIFNINII